MSPARTVAIEKLGHILAAQLGGEFTPDRRKIADITKRHIAQVGRA